MKAEVAPPTEQLKPQLPLDPGDTCVSLCPSVSPSHLSPTPRLALPRGGLVGESQQSLGACEWVISGESLSLTTPSQGLILEQTQAVLMCRI